MYCIYMILQLSIRRSERTGTYIFIIPSVVLLLLTYIYVLYIHDTAGKHKAK